MLKVALLPKAERNTQPETTQTSVENATGSVQRCHSRRTNEQPLSVRDEARKGSGSWRGRDAHGNSNARREEAEQCPG